MKNSSLILIATLLLAAPSESGAQFLTGGGSSLNLSAGVPQRRPVPVDVETTGSINTRPSLKDPCPDQKGQAASNSTFNSVNGLESAVRQNTVGPFKDFVGTCSETAIPGDKAVSIITKRMNEKLKGKKLPVVMKDDKTPATMEDLVAIDVLTRTFAGEIAGLPECMYVGEVNAAAIGCIIANRAKFVAEDNTGKWRQFANEKSRPGVHPYVNVTLKENQFHVWRENNGAHEAVRCPSNVMDGKTVRTTMWPHIFYMEVYKVATEMVLTPQNFAKSCESVPALFYAAGKDSVDYYQKLNFVKLKKVSYNGRPINNPKCVHTWNDPSIKFPAPTQMSSRTSGQIQ